ncbi:hypothetical protein M0813_07804 [Anaeramoeba flamelloides]|uniref:Uncharacterized protein n=1 Tax=Anaeramoeba flamelloides TaxID=1746091 RepID=A0ABQ8XE39_9EUKA|nr:hypothetical protein M0813_07804 [Anaeramoeba flamelloides]
MRAKHQVGGRGNILELPSSKLGEAYQPARKRIFTPTIKKQRQGSRTEVDIAQFFEKLKMRAVLRNYTSLRFTKLALLFYLRH